MKSCTKKFIEKASLIIEELRTVYLLNGSTLNARPSTYLDVNTTNVLTSNDLIYGRYINEKCFNYNFRIRSKKEYLHRSYAFFESKIKNMRSF